MSKYEEKAAKALQEAKLVCEHRPENRGVDLETADEFCGDCGDVTSPYVAGMPRRFPGRQALDLITAKLKEEYPNRLGQVKLIYVEAVAGDEFNVLIELEVKIGFGFRQYRIVRDGDAVTLTRIGKP